MSGARVFLVWMLAVLAFCAPLAPSAQAQETHAALAAPAAGTGRERLIAWLTELARQQTQARAHAIQAIATADAARARQTRARAALTAMIELPAFSGSVVAHRTGLVHEAGIDIENIWYESVPGYRVTANVYVPTDSASAHPAIIIQPGHGPDGKLGNYASL